VTANCRAGQSDRGEDRKAARNALGNVERGQALLLGESPEITLSAGRDEGPVSPLNAGVGHRLAHDEEVSQRLGGGARARDHVDSGRFERERVEEGRDVFGVHVVEEVGVRLGGQTAREGRRAQRRSADADGQDRLGVGDGFDRGPNRVGIRGLGEVQRGVAVFGVRHAALDALVSVGDSFVQFVEVGSGDAGVGDLRKRVTQVYSHRGYLHGTR
jgi:hypothetical protein